MIDVAEGYGPIARGLSERRLILRREGLVVDIAEGYRPIAKWQQRHSLMLAGGQAAGRALLGVGWWPGGPPRHPWQGLLLTSLRGAYRLGARTRCRC
jgi:hypothetical protein